MTCDPLESRTFLSSSSTPATAIELQHRELLIRGTAGDDRIVVKLDRASRVLVRAGEQRQSFDLAALNFIRILGDAGDDRIDLRELAGSLFLHADGGEGNDTILGSAGEDTLDGAEGDDRVVGRRGGDQLFGGTGADIIRGGAGDDYIVAGDDQDIFAPDGSADVLRGGGGQNSGYYPDPLDSAHSIIQLVPFPGTSEQLSQYTQVYLVPANLLSSDAYELSTPSIQGPFTYLEALGLDPGLSEGAAVSAGPVSALIFLMLPSSTYRAEIGELSVADDGFSVPVRFIKRAGGAKKAVYWSYKAVDLGDLPAGPYSLTLSEPGGLTAKKEFVVQ